MAGGGGECDAGVVEYFCSGVDFEVREGERSGRLVDEGAV